MSLAAFARNADLARLRAEGYSASLFASTAGTAHLVIADVPYLTPSGEVARGEFIAAIGLVGERLEPPADHTVHFKGQTPSDRQGQALADVINSPGAFQLAPGLSADFYCSNKRADGANFVDHHEKMTHYVRLLEVHAQSVVPDVTARLFRPVQDAEGDSPFEYIDSATSRAGTGVLSDRLAAERVAIVGLGGTGSYILDLLTKVPIGEIHLFDADEFLSHNAFRAPGAASLADLEARPKKVHYYAERYAVLKRGLVPHAYALGAANVDELGGFDFVFLSMEGGRVKRELVEGLERLGISFIDVGLGVDLMDGQLGGAVTVTASTPGQRDHLRRRVSLEDIDEEALYDRNIQIVELNALNAVLAVIKWKKLRGFYRDEEQEHYSVYRLDSNSLINEEQAS